MTQYGLTGTHRVALLASRLCLLGEDPCGGSEVVLWEDARILESAGFSVRVYARAARKTAPVEILPLHTRNSRLGTLEYARALLHREPGALVLAYNEPALAGFAADRAIVRFDWATPLPRYWNWPFWLSRFQRARYLFPGENEREAFLQRHARIPLTQTIVVPNAVDLNMFRPCNQSPQSSHNRPLKVGFAGQWSAGKGMSHLLDAWTHVKSLFPAAQLYIAGGPGLWRRNQEAPGTGEAVSRVQDMHQRKLLHSVGPLSRARMPQFWNSVDIAVVPSLSESFGLVALEALACGVPVVATAVGGLREIVVQGECGLLVQPADPLALAQAVCHLLTDQALRRRLGVQARIRAEKFSLARRSQELLKLFGNETAKAA